jgi:hypothetical protein
MLAPLATSDSGMPRPSTRRLRLRPFFPPVGRIGPGALLPQRRLVHGSIDTLPCPRYAFHLVVLGQTLPPDPKEEAFLLPTLEMRVYGAGAAILLRQCLPLTSGPKHVDEGREYVPRRHRLATSSRFAPVAAALRPFSLRNQRFNLAPQRVRHGPRLDLCHLALHLRPIPLVTNTII